MAKTPEATLAGLARGQAGVFTTEQALAAGFSPARCGTNVEKGTWQRLVQGVYRINGAQPTWLQRVWAVCLETRGAASHRTAAWLHGLDGIGRWAPRDLEVIVALDNNRRSDGANVRRSRTLLPKHLRTYSGVPMTNLARTIIDLSEVLEPKPLGIAFNSALRQVADLRDWTRRLLKTMPARGHRGIAKLRVLLDQTGAPVDSALEVMVLDLIRAAKLPEPVPGLDVLEGGHVAKLDFAWPDNSPRVLMMVHGLRWHGHDDQWQRDNAQASQLAGLGWRVLTFTMKHVTQEPKAVVRDLRRALAGYQARAQLTDRLEHE